MVLNPHTNLEAGLKFHQMLGQNLTHPVLNQLLASAEIHLN